MRIQRFFYLIMALSGVFIFPRMAIGFIACSGNTTDVAVFTADRNLTILNFGPRNTSCGGLDAGRDAARISKVALNPKLVAAGFTGSLRIGSNTFPLTGEVTTWNSNNTCIWPSATCFFNNSGYLIMSKATESISVELTRPPGGSGFSLDSNEVLATVTAITKNANGTTLYPWGSYTSGALGPFDFIFKLGNGVVITNPYTCTRTSPVDGQQIILPSVSAADLNGSPANNRYTAKSAPVNFVLQCEAGTRVKIKFTSDHLMPGTGTAVLANIDSSVVAGTEDENVGVQLIDNYTNPGTPKIINMDDTFWTVTGSATAGQTFSLDAYYYRKGQVRAGKVKANATFEMSYE